MVSYSNDQWLGFTPIFNAPSLFYSLYLALRPVWEKHVQGAPGVITEFWRSMAETQFSIRHPILRPDNLHWSIPLGFHGDAGSFSHQESVFLFSWNSLVGAGPPTKRFLFTLIKKSEMVAGTIDEILRLFAWSINACQTGELPSRNHLDIPQVGNMDPLAGGFRGTLIPIRGDWEFHIQVF